MDSDSSLVRCHRDLILWQKSMNLAFAIHKVTAGFPKAELFALVSQLRRAAISVPSNIAEGSARKSTREFLHFLRIAHGSLAEIQTQLELARRIDYLSDASYAALNDEIDEVGKILNALVAGLQRRLRQPPKSGD
ncbi:MAG TPA: four helix bundle protein [Steroidobacteraceae bacterium]|nr:four helix bundle protein [Steroidobacteraceae bacterium]